MTEGPGTDQQTVDRYDVVILGGGAAGLTLALQLADARPSTRILVLERNPHPVPEATHKVGESTGEIAAHYLRTVLGLTGILEQQITKFGLRMFFSSEDNEDIARRVELGHPEPAPYGLGTYQLDRGRLENALGQEVRRRGVEFRDGTTVRRVGLEAEREHHRLRVADPGGDEQEVEARWVVDATGRSSLLGRRLRLARKVDHHVNAAWFRVGTPIDIGQWSDDPDWRARVVGQRREFSTNHLMGPGYWVWLIRLASDAISIGIAADAGVHPFERINRFDRALAWLREHEPQCARIVDSHADDVRDFHVMKDYAYGCEQAFSDERWCLAGEAALFLDPLYSAGLDLIAIGNGLITDLVVHALDGEDVEERAAIHNQMYLVLAQGWLRFYENQYPVMGNARVMVAKVVWDTTVYWAVPGLLFYHDMFRRLGEFPGIVVNLARFATVSEHAQRFFREWSAIDRSGSAAEFLSFYDYDFMAGFQAGMNAHLPDAELQTRLGTNVRFIEQLTGQLVCTVIDELSSGHRDERTVEQVRRWREDPALTELVAAYHRDAPAHPTSSGWITLNRGLSRREPAR